MSEETTRWRVRNAIVEAVQWTGENLDAVRATLSRTREQFAAYARAGGPERLAQLEAALEAIAALSPGGVYRAVTIARGVLES